MKKILLLFVLFAAGFSAASAQAVIKFDKTSHNFGTFKESQPQQVEFNFTNTGDKPLIIQQAFSSCGCTVPSFTDKPIAPGESGKVTVVFNGKNKFHGPFRKVVTVHSNATNKVVRLYLQGVNEADKK